MRLSTHADEIGDTDDDESGPHHKCTAEHMCVLDREDGVGEGEVMGRLGRRTDDEKGAGRDACQSSSSYVESSYGSKFIGMARERDAI